MPRYLRVADVPAILGELKEEGSSKPPYQLDEWQHKWCEFTGAPEEDAAVLSYRWRIRGRAETIKDYKTWMSDCGREGYAVHDLRDGELPVDWTLADGHAIQIEVAAWLLWLYTHQVAKYAWVDQMCVPQDVDIEEKMGHIKDSPAIYKAGKVFVIIAPVVDYRSGRIMLSEDARAIVKQYNDQMNNYRGASFLSRSAVKALLVNNSYMRRVWTIQEAVAAQDLTMWPLKGRGEVNSYQSIYVVDWPEFNAWNGHPELGALYLRFGDEALNDYYEGDYTGVISILRSRQPGAIAHLANISKDLMWITMDRNGLVNDIKRADSAAKRAWVVLNNHQISSARSFLPEDRVLALVPLVDYPGWKAATEGVPGRHLVQASVAWAYGVMEGQMASWKWSMRIYNSCTCGARGLELLQPRRNLGDFTAMHGTEQDWSQEIPTEGGLLSLPPPSPDHPDPSIAAYLSAVAAPSRPPASLRVLAALLMPHPGQAQYWGGGPWTHIRDVLQTDEVFRLSVQWALEPWRNPGLKCEVQRSAVVVLQPEAGAGEGVGALRHPLMVIAALEEGQEEPERCQVMMVVEVSSHLLPALLDGLRSKALGELTAPLTLVSAGATPPPPPPEPECAPAPAEPEWQMVSVPPPPEEEEQQQPVEAEGGEEAPAGGEDEVVAPAPVAPGSTAGSRPASAAVSARQPSSVKDRPPSAAAAPPSAASRQSSSARPASARPASARPPSAKPAAPAVVVTAAATAAVPGSGEVTEVVPAAAGSAAAPPPPPPEGAAIQKGGEAGAPPNSGVEVAAGAKYAGQAPVVQGDDGPCKGCVIC